MFSKKPNQKPRYTPKSGETYLQTMAGEVANWLRALFSLHPNWQKNLDITKNNYLLGVKHFNNGKYSDAAFRLKLTTWLDPAQPEAWYYLGRSLLAEGKKKEALHALKKALAQKPGHEEVMYMLALAAGDKIPENHRPKHIPHSLVKEHFDALAPDFNAIQLEEFQYKGHILLPEAVKEQVVPERVDYRILELGVGTGLCGAALRPLAAQITGIDMSQGMLDIAKQLATAEGAKLYDVLIRAEVHDYLGKEQPDSYDIVCSAGLASYVGDLSRLCNLVVAVLRPGGIFVFSADKHTDEGCHFVPAAAAFQFSAGYLESVAKAAGFSEAKCREVDMYPDQKSLICVCRK